MQPIFEVKNLTKTYNGGSVETAALRGVSLTIAKGESLAIVGKSGSGKSTLMHVLATLDKPTAGEVIVDGRNVTNLEQGELARIRNQKFGFVFQQFFLNGRNTCLENVILPLVIMGVGSSERKKRGMEVLQSVGLAELANKKASDLSGGQKQRLCIARALITRPEIIFADEPTGNLDSENGRNIVSMLFSLQKEKGITLVIVTHDPDLAALCDRTVTIKDGLVVGDSRK